MEFIKHFHSGLRWVVLILALLTIIKALMGMQKKSPFTNADNKISLVLISFMDIQLITGLVLYVFGPMGLKNIQNMGMGEVMKNSYTRFFAMEHLIGMLIAIVVFHIGRSKSKKATDDASKHKKEFIFYLIGLLIILASIPWPFKAGFEGIGWF
jgi:uncharacterized membrane protein